uniref:Protein tyrosine phosphatase non-receptor type 14 n=1 Tax=Equus asinus asinus TaxID=83772 RepID=A0A8C4PGZ8_EQUAS
MPFGLKLRRTRRYNVLSKNCFVTRIRLLDSNVIECTLSVESTGQECLEAVAQRLELRETHYFGLWFLSKSQQARWVELEKPLKKHLDKFANEPLLFFGVMFYVPNVSWLQQEATSLLGGDPVGPSPYQQHAGRHQEPAPSDRRPLQCRGGKDRRGHSF